MEVACGFVMHDRVCKKHPVLLVPLPLMLIIFGGLPGTGKTTLARLVARRLAAVHVRIDTLEQAMIHAGMIEPENMGSAGYMVGYAVALDNLRLGLTVVADSVNPLSVTRDAWRQVAKAACGPCLEVETVCSDKQEHRRRVETRSADIPGHALPDWHSVQARHYEPWDRPHLIIDTATLSIEAGADAIIEAVLTLLRANLTR